MAADQEQDPYIVLHAHIYQCINGEYVKIIYEAKFYTQEL